MYLHLTRFFVRPDDLLNTNYGRSGFGAERPILVPSKYLQLGSSLWRWSTRWASPQRDEARLGSAHTRNDRGCGQIEALIATVLPRGTSK